MGERKGRRCKQTRRAGTRAKSRASKFSRDGAGCFVKSTHQGQPGVLCRTVWFVSLQSRCAIRYSRDSEFSQFCLKNDLTHQGQPGVIVSHGSVLYSLQFFELLQPPKFVVPGILEFPNLIV